MLTEATVLAALKDCFDPDLRCNIVDLGLVYGVHLAPDQDAPGAGIAGVPQRFRVSIDLTLTAQDNPSQAQIIALIENRLAGIYEISQTTIHLVWEPPWTPERITPEGRRTLGLDRSRRDGGGPGTLVQIVKPL